jgi:hypothetical protein
MRGVELDDLTAFFLLVNVCGGGGLWLRDECGRMVLLAPLPDDRINHAKNTARSASLTRAQSHDSPMPSAMC